MKKKKKRYTVPEIETVRLDYVDVLSASAAEEDWETGIDWDPDWD